MRRALRAVHAERGNTPLSEEDLAAYDRKTVFYDVFIPPGGRQVVALGPPLLNLRRSLLPMEVYCNGRRIEYIQRESLYLWKVRFPLPEDCPGKTFTVEFRFPAFAVRTRIAAAVQVARKRAMGLSTLQKDNPAHWIVDWCRWHCTLHGIELIMLYDNGSDNHDNVVEALCNAAVSASIILIQWPFPYGTPGNRRNQFAQIGALNHAREYFGPVCDWILNLDVDEYLATSHRGSLRRFIEHERLGAWPVLLFDSWIVPPEKERKDMRDRAVTDYSVRCAQPAQVGLKYMYRPSAVSFNRAHIAYPESGWLQPWGRFRYLRMKLLLLLYQSITKRISRMPLFRMLWPFRSRVHLVPMRQAWFYHFRGLNTNWKLPLGDWSRKYECMRLVPDHRLAQMFARAGLRRKQRPTMGQ